VGLTAFVLSADRSSFLLLAPYDCQARCLQSSGDKANCPGSPHPMGCPMNIIVIIIKLHFTSRFIVQRQQVYLGANGMKDIIYQAKPGKPDSLPEPGPDVTASQHMPNNSMGLLPCQHPHRTIWVVCIDCQGVLPYECPLAILEDHCPVHVCSSTGLTGSYLA